MSAKTPSRKVEVVVLGAGPGGSDAAARLAQLGKEVLLLDREGPGAGVGGVCLHSGCIPSKALIDTAHHLHKIKELSARGVTLSGEIKVDFKKLQEWKRGVSAKLRSYIEQGLKAAGVKVEKGEGRLMGPHQIEIRNGENPGIIEFEKAILATGSRAIELPHLPFDGKKILNARHALDLEEIPASLLVVGGGYIGLELGIAFRKFGSQVAVAEMQGRLLPGTDAALVRPLSRRLEELGIKVHLNAKVESVQGSTAKVVQEGGKAVETQASHVLVAVGRRPNTEDLGLSAAKVQVDAKGFISTNAKKQTNVPHIYAIGDITQGPALAHKASAEGAVAAEAICGLPAAFDPLSIPAVVFADPELSYTGLSEAQAKEKGFEPKSVTLPNRGLGRALAAGETEGMAKLVYDEKSGRLLGALLAGGPATDMIAGLGLAIEMGATMEDLALTIFPHPTFSEQAALAARRVAHQKK